MMFSTRRKYMIIRIKETVECFIEYCEGCARPLLQKGHPCPLWSRGNNMRIITCRPDKAIRSYSLIKSSLLYHA